MRAKIFAMLLLALVFTGCATENFNANPDLLSFLNDGKTTKEEVMIKLGQPSGRFEGERILTYRLGFDPHNKGYYLVERPPNIGFGQSYSTWSNTKYSLVLVFDGQNVLREHSLVEVTK